MAYSTRSYRYFIFTLSIFNIFVYLCVSQKFKVILKCLFSFNECTFCLNHEIYACHTLNEVSLSWFSVEKGRRGKQLYFLSSLKRFSSLPPLPLQPHKLKAKQTEKKIPFAKRDFYSFISLAPSLDFSHLLLIIIIGRIRHGCNISRRRREQFAIPSPSTVGISTILERAPLRYKKKT